MQSYSKALSGHFLQLFDNMTKVIFYNEIILDLLSYKIGRYVINIYTIGQIILLAKKGTILLSILL